MENENQNKSMETKENSLLASLHNSIVVCVPEDMSNEDIESMLEDAMREQAEEERIQSEAMYETMMEMAKEESIRNEAMYETMMEMAKEEHIQSMMEEAMVHDPSELEALLKIVTAQKEVKTPDSDNLRDSQ